MPDLLQICFDYVSYGVACSAKLFTLTFWSDLLITYKYWVVVFGGLIEGELILMLAAASAYHGHISIYWVVICAVLGAIFHDHVLFYVGGRLGKRAFQNPKYKRRVGWIQKLVDRYGIYFVATFRFLYGIRTVTPLFLGASQKFSWRVYSTCVVISSTIWGLIIGYLGYTFALVFEHLVDEFKRVKGVILYVVMSCFVVVVSVYILKRLLRDKGIR